MAVVDRHQVEAGIFHRLGGGARVAFALLDSVRHQHDAVGLALEGREIARRTGLAAGTITTDEALLIEQSYVLPLWLGNHPGHFPRDGATAGDWIMWENRLTGTYIRQQLSATAATAINRTDGTSSGVTVAATEQPRIVDISANVRLPLVRR